MRNCRYHESNRKEQGATAQFMYFVQNSRFYLHVGKVMKIIALCQAKMPVVMFILQNFARWGANFEKVKGVFKMIVGNLTDCRTVIIMAAVL